MDIDRAFYLIRAIQSNCNNRYAIAYCDAARNAYEEYGEQGLRTQILYILNNLSGWRGEKASLVKKELNTMI